MVLIDHPQQQDVPQDGTPSPETQSRGRHAARTQPGIASRFRRRRRWPIMAAGAALGVLVVPPPAPRRRAGAAGVGDDAAVPGGLASSSTISFLSSGAPTGAIRVATAPTQVGDQQPTPPPASPGRAATAPP